MKTKRLNTGGIPLSQSDLLLSRIKERHYDFEENLQLVGKSIYNVTGKGYLFSAYNILQVLYLLIKGSIRVDPQKIKTADEIDRFKEVWAELQKPLLDFFSSYLWERFHINHNSILPRSLALLPLIVYFYEESAK